MTLLEKRADTKEAILKGRFIKRELTEEGEEFQAEQTKIMARNSFRSPEFYAGRNILVNETMLKYQHFAKHRFVDMKRRQTASGSKKKVSYPIHNRLLYAMANNIIKRLSFGYTQSVKEEMATLEKSLNF